MRWPFTGLRIEWSEEKNLKLIRARGVSFDDVVRAIEEDQFIDLIPHWDERKYSHQKAIVVLLNGYIHVVPCVVDKEKVFFKTIFPSRKIAQKYLSNS
ncbi:hypothetical protein A3H16_01490 [Candidatus Kaiserbacteria bacterium RIFCSPLOWO2_12_FULL_53_8]|uniref:Toxin n=2 Tax=Candidatus Kaiseribacteriota TaxID=1752734 RepID=A0A1F6CWE5_9BACT|nr:MAG: hypothetical protein A2851_00225 [Candidatus Kaiserbacteria bacterium RIFCSPHIGHO2_01_FULL_53_29]OGG91083.1 MAG: hypothetical protein A3H16_01490 [Candidatus Kaiserbacteria bacterium RIFCSPLOWO2_12_FULL_53_8]